MRARLDSRLGDDHPVARRPRDELELRAPVDREVGEVARIDPDHLGAECDRPLELGRVVRLDERVETELFRVRLQRGRTLVVEVAQEQEHRVRAGELRLEQLQLLGEEALREQRHVRCRPCGLHVRERAAEALVDEDRHGCRARALERDGELDRVGARAQISRGRRAPLHLGDRTETGRA